MLRSVQVMKANTHDSALFESPGDNSSLLFFAIFHALTLITFTPIHFIVTVQLSGRDT